MAWKNLKRLFDFLASLELAVFVLLALSAVLAVGTVVESKYGLFVAQQSVYHSIWNEGLLWLLLINVLTVALSRWPWKKHHTGFLITHLGIIVLLLGGFMTQKAGVDGTLALGIGESANSVRVDEAYLNVFRAIPSKNYELLLSERTPWNILSPLRKPKVYTLASGDEVRVLRYFPKARREITMSEAPKGTGIPAIRFRLEGSRAKLSDMMFLQGTTATSRDLGPAILRFQKEKPASAAVEKPTLFIVASEITPQLFVAMPGKKLQSFGAVGPGKTQPLGWMDFAFTIDEYHASAAPHVTYYELPNEGPALRGTTPVEALLVSLNGEERWLELGASAQVARSDAIYYVQYVKRSVDIGFDLLLKDFQVGYYPGTTRPMSYASRVSAGGEEHRIAMNEPLHKNGFTFYQSSYESDENGRPTLSVFTVNRDPGRWVKYTGALMIVLGILSMFYFKPMYTGKNKWLLGRKKESA